MIGMIAAVPDVDLSLAAPRLLEIESKFAPKFAGTTARYTPPTCDNVKRNEVCAHAAHYHEPSGADLDDSLRYFGLKRDRKGASYFPQHTAPRPESKIPTRTQENIAACGAVGLSYWSEADGPNMLWAVDDNQRAHEVKIDRKAGKARAECSNTTRYDPVREWSRADTKLACTHDHGWHPWTLARTQDELSLQLEGGIPHRIENIVERSKRSREQGPEVIYGHIGPTADIEDVETHDEWMARMNAKGGLNAPDPEDVSVSLGPTGYCVHGKHLRCAYRDGGPSQGGIALHDGAHYSCPCECHSVHQIETGIIQAAKAEARTAAIRDPKHATNVAAAALKVKTGTAYDACGEKPMSREQAMALLAHDPDYLGDITNTALVDLLECADAAAHHQAIRDELRVNRGLSEKAS